MIKSVFFNDTDNPRTKSEKLNIKAEPLFYARELPAEDSHNEEENDSETQKIWETLLTDIGK